jgi:cyclohexa-1,5-dienecarbonyl-CoA hydratase
VTAEPLVRTEWPENGWARLILNRPPGNIMTMAMCDALQAALVDASCAPETKLVSIEGEGAHFSYGASVEEHAPGRVSLMLPAFHGLVFALLAAPCATAAIVRGRCLGGGLEITLACDLVFASADVRMGVPEVSLGVFPPAAAALLPLRVGTARASRAVLSGEALPVEWWTAAGLLANDASGDPLSALHAWYRKHFAPLSAVALRHAARATRQGFVPEAVATIRALERQYLDELMSSYDAVEGCAAFVARRPPQWRHA